MKAYTGKSYFGGEYEIKIDYEKDKLLPDFSTKTLRDRYLLEDEKSPQEAFARAACFYAEDQAHAQRIYNYASNHWFMFATPVLANAGNSRGEPISCFLNYVEDSREGILRHYTENGWLSSIGGGLGGYWGEVRPLGSKISRGGTSTGVIPFISVVDRQVLAFNQGATRRGSYAAYLDVSHPEIEEFIQMRRPTGDSNRRSPNLHSAIVISDKFMVAVENDDPWELIDPNTNKTIKTVNARTLWKAILSERHEFGEPYIMFGDTVNRNQPEVHKKLGNKVHQSNLCSEITLPTGRDHLNRMRTAVCCLSSINLEYFRDWESHAEEFIYDLVLFLDNTLEAFIKENVSGPNSNAAYSALRERSIGLGTMGFHSMLQKANVPFESASAISLNKLVFRTIQENAKYASERIAMSKGAAPDCIDAGERRRNVNLIAIAPNASSGIICGNTSPGIEPLNANQFKQVTLSGSYIYRNKFLDKLFEMKYGKDQNEREEIWYSILQNEGSVQHLDFMDDWDKDVFKTAYELDQSWLVQHAADRQEFICQAQSLNLFFPAKVELKHLNKVHIEAWKKGVKTLYYLRSKSIRVSESTNKKLDYNKIKDYSEESCLACAN